MKIISKKTSNSVGSGKPRPRPRPRTSAATMRNVETNSSDEEENRRRRTYRRVASTPLPPGEHSTSRKNFIHASGHAEASPAASVIEVSDSSDDAAAVSKTGNPSRGARTTGGTMTTRSSSGIVKKRVLEDAAIFSDTEAMSALSPSKKRKQNKSRVPGRSSMSTTSKPAARGSATGSRSRTDRYISPLASDFLSSDDTPLPSIATGRQMQKKYKEVPTDRSSLSKKSRAEAYSVGLDSTPKVEWYDEEPVFDLLPSVAIDETSRVGQRSTPDPDFEAQQRRESRYSSKLQESERGATPDWPSRNTKGKAPMPALIEEPFTSGDENLVDEKVVLKQKRVSKYRISSTMKPPASSSKVATSSALSPSQPGVVINSFEAALAKKGITLEKTLEKPATGSPSPSKGASSTPLSPSQPGVVINSFEAALAEKGITLAKALDKPATGSPSKEVYLADLSSNHVISLPETCEVNSPDIHDVLLGDDYASLPNLTAGSFRSWSSATGDGYVMFSGWATQLPSLDINRAFAAVRFVQHGHFVNLSRVSPVSLHGVFTTHDNLKAVLHANNCIAICLSPILVMESHLLTATDRGLRNKFIKGTLHEQEMQRFVASTCMAFGHGPVLHAQIDRDSMIFSTKGNWGSDVNTGPSSPAKYIRASSLLRKSPEKASGRFTKQILDVTDKVPIYDARQHPFDYAADLDNIASVLPSFSEEVPPGSFAVAAYTMTTFKKGGNWHLNTNVQFVILVKAFNEQ